MDLTKINRAPAQQRGQLPFPVVGCSFSLRTRTLNLTLVRAGAAKVLADDPDRPSGEALARAVSDKSWIVRAAALDAIARRGDPALLDSVLTAMSEGKDIVKYTAAAVIELSAVHGKKQ